MSTIPRTVGIDISKDWLDAFPAPEGGASRFSNDRAGFRKLIAWIGSEVDRIDYEPSGHWKGRSFIQGGRHRVRRLLYMPALAAVQHNPDLKRKCEALVAKGKPPKVALTAVMRKLLILANTLVQQDRIWTARPPREYSCPAFPVTPCPVGGGHV